ncbi:hypothetical protein PIROE2DRAFT_6470 [Piromyces sp. E2]|nr:hypothetical protein PIROE2DRAFT_6470 [Piromyces sp. E2]|eukprot:OUM66332.1 hypothetical protein PIROE2DRAFT_6470 [Piromyces sp. E2]
MFYKYKKIINHDYFDDDDDDDDGCSLLNNKKYNKHSCDTSHECIILPYQLWLRHSNIPKQGW